MLSRHEFRSTRSAAVWSRPAPAPQTDAAPVRGRVRSALFTGVVLAGVWQALHWGDLASWLVGLPTVLGGALVASALPPVPRPRLRPSGALRFAGFVARGVLQGAFDVGIRSLRPRTLSPGFVPYRTDLPDGAPRRLFALCITLMPGTLTVRLDGAHLIVHALDRSADTAGDLRALERRVAAVYGPPTPGDMS